MAKPRSSSLNSQPDRRVSKDPEFIAALDKLRGKMSGTELRMLDILKGVEPDTTNTPRKELSSTLLPFLAKPRRKPSGVIDDTVRFSKRRIEAWFRVQFTGLIYC